MATSLNLEIITRILVEFKFKYSDVLCYILIRAQLKYTSSSHGLLLGIEFYNEFKMHQSMHFRQKKHKISHHLL